MFKFYFIRELAQESPLVTSLKKDTYVYIIQWLNPTDCGGSGSRSRDKCRNEKDTTVQNLHHCYLTLGVSKDATKEEITKAFKDLARQHHPDKSAGGSSASEERMKEINGAFRTLSETWKLELDDGKGGTSAKGRGAAGVEINRARRPGVGAFSPGNSTTPASPSSSTTLTPGSLSHSPEL